MTTKMKVLVLVVMSVLVPVIGGIGLLLFGAVLMQMMGVR